MKSSKGDGKVDEQAFRRRACKRLIIRVVSAVVLVALITVAVVMNKNNDSPASYSVRNAGMTPSASLRAVCSVTRYPDWCFSSIASLEPSKKITDREIFFKLSLQAAIQEHVKVIEWLTKLTSQIHDKQVQEALKVCRAAFDDALEALKDSLSSMEVGQGEKLLLSPSQVVDINTRLTVSMTYQQKCRDSLEELDLDAMNSRETIMKNSTQTAGKSLAISSQILGLVSNYNIPPRRRLASWVAPGRWRHAPGDEVKAGGGGGPHHHQNGGG